VGTVLGLAKGLVVGFKVGDEEGLDDAVAVGGVVGLLEVVGTSDGF